ncbi:MAG: CBS domain-containing protein, partial [bacterium]
SRPKGIVTDRDIVIRCVAEGRDAESLPVSEIMSSPVRSGHEAMPLDEALQSMQSMAARRLVVTGDDGELVGILTLDDVLELLVEQTGRIGDLLEKQGRAVLSGKKEPVSTE